jgi:hypothetical protein
MELVLLTELMPQCSTSGNKMTAPQTSSIGTFDRHDNRDLNKYKKKRIKYKNILEFLYFICPASNGLNA